MFSHKFPGSGCPSFSCPAPGEWLGKEGRAPEAFLSFQKLSHANYLICIRIGRHVTSQSSEPGQEPQNLASAQPTDWEELKESVEKWGSRLWDIPMGTMLV